MYHNKLYFKMLISVIYIGEEMYFKNLGENPILSKQRCTGQKGRGYRKNIYVNIFQWKIDN